VVTEQILANHYYRKNKELYLVLSCEPGAGLEVTYRLIGSTIEYKTRMETFLMYFKIYNP
jgi:hypothetical protein